jgi:hypothetical protein
MEIWKTADYLHDYYFSNLGRYKIGINGKPKTPTTRSSGYCIVFRNHKKYKGTWLIHRIVADLFIEKIEGKNIVDHINGLRDDNRVENLRWVTTAENNKNRRNDGVKCKKDLEDKNNFILPEMINFLTQSLTQQIKEKDKQIFSLMNMINNLQQAL